MIRIRAVHTLLIGLLLSAAAGTVSAQFFNEDFEAGTAGTDWQAATLTSGTWTYDGLFTAARPTATVQTKTWTIEPNISGAPTSWGTKHARFYWSPSITNYSVALISPTIDLSAANAFAALNFELGNDGFGTAGDHKFEIWLSANGGTSWTLATSIGDNASTIAYSVENVVLNSVLPAMIGSPTCKIAVVLHSDMGTAGIDYWRLDNIRIIDPTKPTLKPATGSQFNSQLVATGKNGTTFSGYNLTADDINDATIDIAVTSSNPIPGVTAPSGGTGVSVPAALQWTGAPTAGGTYSYTVTLNDGTNNEVFTVTFVIATYTSSFPYFQGFESSPPYGNALFKTDAQTVPTVINPTQAPGSNAVTGSSGYQVATTAIAGSNPQDGSGMLSMYGGTGTGATSMDLLFDMSTFSTSDYVELEFYWNDEGIDNNAATNALQGVFLSTDGGATWQAVVYQFPHSLNTGIWNHQSIDLSPIMTNLSLSYTSQMVIRFQIAEDLDTDIMLLDSIRIPDPSPALRIFPVSGASTDAVAGATGTLVATVDTFSLNSTQSLNSITFTQVGTANNANLTNLKLWEDTNTDGIFNAGDNQLGSNVAAMAGATVTFSGAPMRSYTTNQSMRLFVTADIAAVPTVPAYIQFQVAASTDVSTNPGGVEGTFPVDLDQAFLKAPVTSYPFVQDFETAPPYFHSTFTTGAQTVPTVTATPPSTPGSSVTTGASGYQVTAGPILGSSPNSGTGMLDMFGGTGTGATAMDFWFDMSGFSTSDVVTFEFYWNDEGLDILAATDVMQGVFLSTNGGTTWEAALFQFPTNTTEGVWNHVTMDLSTVLTTLTLNYTGQMVIRFQMAENSTADHLLIDDIRVEDPAPHLTVLPVTGLVAAAFGGQNDQVLASVDTVSVNSTQALSNITFTQIGTANNSDITNLKLWEDTNGDNVFSTGDTQLGSTVATMSGSTVTFTGAPLRSYTNNQAMRLFVTGNIAAAPTVPANIQMRVTAASDVTATPGYVGGSFPIDLDSLTVVAPVSSLPHTESFDGTFSNILFQSGTGQYPAATAAGATVTMSNFTNPGRVQVTSSISPVTPQSAPNVVLFDYPNSTAAAAMDMLFDLSAYTVATHTIDLDFWWTDYADENDNEDLVLISNDGGATWIAIYKFNLTGNADGTWQNVSLDLTAALQAAGQNYTSNMIIRFQGQDDSPYLGTTGGDGLMIDDVTVELAAAALRVNAGPQPADRIAMPGDTDVVIGSFFLTAVNSNQSISTITVSKTGTITDTDVAGVKLWADTNSDGVFSTGDTQLGATGAFSGGIVNFTGAPLLNLSSTSATVFVTADISATSAVPESLGCSIAADTDVTTTPGAVSGTFPVNGGGTVTVIQPATLPYTLGFETAAPYANSVIGSGAQTIPTVVTVGAAPGSAAVSGSSGWTVTGAVNTSVPVSGSGMFDMFGGTGTGATTLDLYFDLSAISTSDAVNFDFYWNDEGLDVSAITDAYQGVFVSTDGGATWELAVFQFDTSFTAGWNYESVNLSAMMSALSLSYTAEMVIRFQMAENSTVDHLLIDDIRLQILPDIDISRGGTTIANNGIDLVGTQPIATPISLTYDVANVAPTGANVLNFTSAVQIGTTYNCNVSITAQPSTGQLNPGQADAFSIDVTPISGGTFLVEVLLSSDDPDENPYQITIIGTGAEPEIDVQRPAGTSIADGGTDNLGGVAENVTQALTYYIVNGGNTSLLLTGTPIVDIQNVSNLTVSVIQQPTITTLSPAALAPFQVELTPGSGAFSFDMVIANSDPNEGNYTITVSGTGLSTPEIDILDPNSAALPQGGVFSVGTVTPGSSNSYTFTIQNNGNMDLSLIGSPVVQILSPVNATATVTAVPNTTIAVGGSTTFTIQVAPTASGSFSFNVQILNDDANEGAYTFTVAGFAGVVGGGSGGGGDSGGGCSTGSDNYDGMWALLLGALALLIVASRLRAWRKLPS